MDTTGETGESSTPLPASVVSLKEYARHHWGEFSAADEEDRAWSFYSDKGILHVRVWDNQWQSYCWKLMDEYMEETQRWRGW